MDVADPLEDVQIESRDFIAMGLDALRGGDLAGGAILPEIELRYRLIGIAVLLSEANPRAFRDNLHRSACAALHHFELREQGVELEPASLTVNDNPGFADAVIAGDMELAARIGELSPSTYLEGYEYEDDFLRYHLLHRMLLGGDDAELHGILERWEAVLEGATSTPWALSAALVARDAEAFDTGLRHLIDAHVIWFEEFRNSTGYVPEFDATLGKVLMNGLVILRFAEMRDVPTECEYRFMPDLARLPVGREFPPRDAWRILPPR